MLAFRGLCKLELLSANPSALVAFYERALGLRFAEDAGNAAPAWKCQLGSTLLVIRDLQTLEQRAPLRLSWEVDDVDAIAARLESAGVPFSRGGTADDDWGHCDYWRWLHVSDPDGNQVSILSVAEDQRDLPPEALFPELAPEAAAELIATLDPRGLANLQLRSEYLRERPFDSTERLRDAALRIFGARPGRGSSR